MGARVKLKFAEPEKLLQNFLKALSQGHLKIPINTPHQSGEELELELILPGISALPSISVQVESPAEEPNKLKVRVSHQEEVEELLNRLAEVPAYSEFIKSLGARQIKIEEEKEAVLKAENRRREQVEEPEVVLHLRAPEPEKGAEKDQKESEPQALKTSEEPEVVIKPKTAEPEKKLKGETPAPREAQLKKKPIMREEIYTRSEKPERKEPGKDSAEMKVKVKEVEPAESPKSTKAPLIREKVMDRPREGERTITEQSESEKPKAEVVELERKESAEPGREVETKPGEGLKPKLSADPLTQLKNWLVKPKEKEKKEGKKKEGKKEEKEEEKEKELIDYEPASKFVQSLVKAMLRTGYYSPDHPGAKDAKTGLYKEFTEALGDKEEIGFVIQFRPGQTPEFLVTGISSEPMTLKKLLGAGAVELFFPKYVDYFERKKLISLSIKKTISKTDFHKFVDIMSDPTVDQGGPSESGRLLTRMLAEHNITDISAVFEDDLIVLESKLPWRVEMGIHRLAKDLKMVPLYKGISQMELRRLKAKIVQDIIRPLRRPEFLKDILLNLYLIARQVPGIDREELEETVVDNFPMNMLIPTSEYVFQELHRLQELKLETEEQKELIGSRIESIKSILKKIAVKVLMEEVEGTGPFLEQLFYHKIVTFEELPPEVQEKVNIQIMADEFQKQPYVWLGKFMDCTRGEDLELFIQYFQKIIVPLLDRKDFQSLYMITEQISKLPEKKRQALAERGIPDLNQAVWGRQVPRLLKILLEESAGVRKGVEEIFLRLGEFGLQKLYEELLEESDSSKRKILIEILIRFGPKSLDRLRGILKDPAKSPNLQMLALEALGRAGEKTDINLVKTFLKHSKPELRAEAISALVRIAGQESISALETLSGDPDPGVKKRWIAALGFLARENSHLRSRLSEVAFDEKQTPELRAQALQELKRNPPETEEERQSLQKRLLELVCQKQSFSEKIRHRFKGQTEEQDKPKIAGLDLLGKIGDSQALEALSHLKLAGKELETKLEEVLRQLRLRLSAEK